MAPALFQACKELDGKVRVSAALMEVLSGSIGGSGTATGACDASRPCGRSKAST